MALDVSPRFIGRTRAVLIPSRFQVEHRETLGNASVGFEPREGERVDQKQNALRNVVRPTEKVDDEVDCQHDECLARSADLAVRGRVDNVHYEGDFVLRLYKAMKSRSCQFAKGQIILVS